MARPDAPRLSIVIPAHNEAARLPRTLDRLRHYLESRNVRWEIVVVSNGSTDDTDHVVEAARVDMPFLRAITLAERGKGLATKAGALSAEGEIIFVCDADLSMPPETIDRFMACIESADIVVGSREASGARRFDEPGYRHVMGRIFNYLVKALAVRGINDTQCGFKAFRRVAARHLFSQQTVNGFGFDVELLYLGRKFGYAIEEIGIDWHFDTDSRVRPGIDTINMCSEVVMIRLRDLLGRYRAAPSPAASGGDLAR